MLSVEDPTVSFVVPCYNLGHLLRECVESIVNQTYKNFEILIMDDCSPDNTREVCQSFKDRRMKYIRNEKNLGHLRNYNKGIGLSRGKYVWLISADDKLRSPYVLDKYVALMEINPKVGYAICPAFGMQGRKETSLLKYSWHGNKDQIFDGRWFLCKLMDYNSVVAPCGMVRKEVYDKLGAFRLDLPYGGDWYLWCLFSLHYDVAYFAESMVNYRVHEMSVTSRLMKEGGDACTADDTAVLWHIKRAIARTDHRWLMNRCDYGISRQYATSLNFSKMTLYGRPSGIKVDEFEKSVRGFAMNEKEGRRIRAISYIMAGDWAFQQKDVTRAMRWYSAAHGSAPTNSEAFMKWLLLRCGKGGKLALQTFNLCRANLGLGTRKISKLWSEVAKRSSSAGSGGLNEMA
jgi:glycosyltransferase involved in cell wall biosynthesis